MLATFTESMGLGQPSPLSASDRIALCSLDSIEEERLRKADALQRALQGASVDKLKHSLHKHTTALNSEPALHVSQELTRRGIAPCFRGVPEQGDPWWADNVEADFILLTADLQWIVSHHPDHKPAWQRLESAFAPDKLVKTAEYLHYRGQREPGQAAKALGLSDSQQRELAWIHYLDLKRWRVGLYKRWPIAKAAIARDLQSKPWRSKFPIEGTIKRRGDLWICAELGKWKPQRTADFFAMMTGEVLPRNIVSAQLEKLPRVRRTDQFLSLFDPAVG